MTDQEIAPLTRLPLLSLTLLAALCAASPADANVSRLLGDWQLEGRAVRGQSTTVTLSVERRGEQIRFTRTQRIGDRPAERLVSTEATALYGRLVRVIYRPAAGLAQGVEGATGPALHAYYVISGQGARLRELVIEAVDPPAVVTDVRGERVVAAPVARREPVSTSRAE